MLLRHRYRLLLIIVIASGELSGCSLFSPVKINDVTNYEINTVPNAIPSKKKKNSVMVVSLPASVPAYNTRDMAYSIKPHQLAYFSQNRWVETPAQMLEQLIAQTLIKTHHFKAVITPPFVGKYDYVFSSELLLLKQDFTHRPARSRFKLRASILKSATNEIIATRDFIIEQPFYCNTPYQAVLATNRGVAQALKQIATFTLKAT